MKFPLSKYKFVIHDNEVIAISTYAGKTVRGVAKCHPNDEMDVEKGKILAANRCNVKIARKRLKNAKNAMFSALDMCNIWKQYYSEMADYYIDASSDLYAAEQELARELSKLK